MVASTLHACTSDMLEFWERALSARPWERGDALLAASGLAPASLSARNAALLYLRSQLFGRAQPLRCNCPACGATVEFTIDCDTLARELIRPNDADAHHALAADGFLIEFRIPSPADVCAAAARAADRDAFVRALLERCVTACARADGVACSTSELSATATAELSQRLEHAEPGAVVSFDLSCPECHAQWHALMDCADVLWSEVQSRAERLLLEIDVLARSYGWTESEVLALTPTRRAAYLQLVGAA